ncbi:MAG: hypothetical protein EA374_08305 [Acholeplasmatales bacterium]|nr:MAG: hypothetical protein EA374_08305 [Acholeplasmatales bacterium]
MKKRIMSLGVMFLFIFVLAGCWAGEITVDTIINADGSGERVFILEVMDDTLSEGPILNPEDPDQEKDYGPVLNDKHIEGGIPAIQTWLEENAPAFLTVEPMETEGVVRTFTLRFSFGSFDEFLERMQALVNLSPTLSWDDFDADELPSFVCEGGVCTFTESRIIVQAALDWAIDGIFNSIYDEADLAGFVSKADIAVLASYRVQVIEEVYEEMRHYDPDADDGENPTTGEPRFGKVIFVESEMFELSADRPDESRTPVSCGGTSTSLPVALVALLGMTAALSTAFVLKRR